MALEIYRRHSNNCGKLPTDTSCKNSRRPCSIWIRGTQTDGTSVRESLKTRDWSEAGKLRDKWNGQGEKPVGPAPKATIEDFKTRFLANMKTVNRVPATIKKYEVLFRQIDAFAQDKGLTLVSQFDLGMLEALRATWKDKALAKSKKQERLRGIFRYAFSHKMIDENPALHLDKIKVDPTQVVPFTTEQQDRIWLAAKADKNARMYALALLMRFSGLRISDAVALRLDQIKDGRVSLRTRKVKKDVRVSLPENVLRTLQSIKPASATHFFWDGQGDVIQTANYYRDYY